jgi:predicted P-loop ATPase
MPDLQLVHDGSRGRPTLRQFVAFYIQSRQWSVVPLRPSEKSCRDDNWKELRFTEEDFRPGDNVGLRSVNGIVVSDADCPEAITMADHFLPATGAVWGRPSRLRAKRAYRCSGIDKTITYKDLSRPGKDQSPTILELRSDHQDMMPPSIHPTGERLKWDGLLLDEASVDAESLTRAHRLLATAAFVARHYAAPGTRHDWCLALAGVLRGVGLTEEETQKVIVEAGRYAGEQKPDDRRTEIHSTYARSEEEPIAGAQALRELAGDAFVKSVNKFWGNGGKDHRGFITQNGKINANSQDNVHAALTKLDVRLTHNRFSNTLLIAVGDKHRPAAIDDAVVDALWLTVDKQFGFRPTPDFFEKFLKNEARQHPFHPVADYLAALSWDGTPRIDEWLLTYGCAKDTRLNRAIAAIVLIAAVRRVRTPGCKFDELLVLISPQGSDKSSALKALCPSEAWFSDDAPLGVDSKQVIERTSGKWLIEAAELVGLTKRDADSLKAWLSRQVDGPVRLAYGRNPVEVPRQFITIGTTNTHQFLKDRTGNRRFWPVRVERFDAAALRRDRDQLWAEAAHREATGESIRLDPNLYADAAKEQEERMVEDAWTMVLREALLNPADGSDALDRLLLNDVWDALCIPIERRDERATDRVNAIMQTLGYEKKQARGQSGDKHRDKSAKRWCRVRANGELCVEDQPELEEVGG